MHKIGIIGCGMIAELGHIPAIQQIPNLRLYALYDNHFERARDLQHKFDIPHAYPEEEAFYNSNIDAVVICTPAPVHNKNVKDAAEFNKHALCEKPLGTSVKEMQEMKKIMQEAGLHLFTGFNYRFSQSAKDIHRLVKEQAIGEVRLLRLIYNWHLHGKWQWDEKGERVDSALRKGRMDEGGPLVDCGVHQIDLARWWLESEVEWQSGIGVWIDDYDAPDHIYLHMGHKCGAHSHVEVSFSYNTTSAEPRTNFLYELIGTDGVIRYSREEHSLELRNSHGTFHLPWHPEKSFTGMYEEFVHFLESGSPGDLPSAQDGIRASQIAQEATQQAIRDRDKPSRSSPSTLKKAKEIDPYSVRVPGEYMDLPPAPGFYPRKK